MNTKFLSIAAAFLFAASSQAQFTVLHNFNGSFGSYPASTLTLAGNVLYGAAEGGGLYGYGCIFSMDTNGSNYKDIFDFDDTNGKQPVWSLTLLGHKLYGMAASGGANGWGCIYSLDTDGSGYKDLFDMNFATGADPSGFGSFVFAGKLLFGLAPQGGAHSLGCVFSIDTNGNGYKDLFDFNGTNGENPNGGFTLIGNRLYAIARGGAHGKGCIFSVDTNGSNYNDLFDFNGTNGNNPSTSLILSGSTFYGMTSYGGSNDSGVIFSIDTNGYGFKVLQVFNGLNGNYPDGNLTISRGILYGTTSYGGVSYDSGSIFSIDTNGSGFTELYNFNGLTGAYPLSSLVLSGNVLYGMAKEGGTDSLGVIFRYKDTTLTTSIKRLQSNSGVVYVFPNPNTGEFTISLLKVSEKAEVEIYNSIGEQVYEGALHPSVTQLNLSSQPAGLYLYRVITEQGQLISSGKMIIQ